MKEHKSSTTKVKSLMFSIMLTTIIITSLYNTDVPDEILLQLMV